MRECCNSVDIMPRGCGWLGGGPWEVQWRMGSCGGVKLQSAPISLMYSCLVRPDRQTCYPRFITCCGCNCPTMNSPSRTDRLGRVYNLEWFSKSWSVTNAVLIRRRIQRAYSSLNDATPARPTDPLTLRVDLPSPHRWTYSVYWLDSQLVRRLPASGFTYPPS